METKAQVSATPLTTSLNRIALGDTLYRAARKFGERTAVIESDQHTSYAELDQASSQFAHYLMGQGFSSGAKVAMLCNNSLQFLIATYGILKAGLVWVPINTMLAVNDIRYILDHAEVDMLVLDEQLYVNPVLKNMLDETRLPLCLCEVGESHVHGHITLIQACAGMPDSHPSISVSDHDLAMIMYTSGTTGRQKGAMHSHLSVYSALTSSIAELGIRYNDVLSCVLPMFHCAQFSVAAASILMGAAIFVEKGFNPAAILNGIEKERITLFFGLPLMYAALLHHPMRRQHDLSSLRLCMYAMAPMAKPLLTRLIEEICPNFALGSGQTEIFPMTMYFRPDQQLKRFGNYWGQPTQVNEVAIMDEAGNLLDHGKIGEIVHRGPNVMLGYYKDPEATKNTRRHGWHHTGDLGLMDQDNQLLFIDRMKDMIKTGGENVPSIKVEEVLLRHPAVVNVAVIGIPHPQWIEGVAAFVVSKQGQTCSVTELLEHCRQHLAGFETPKHITLLESLPTTSTGKIQKHVLRSRYQTLFAD